jgi:CheY-like chemotaxis protein
MAVALLENSRERLHARLLEPETPLESDDRLVGQCRPPGILIADDEPWILYLISQSLRKLGCQVWLAANGREAVETYRRLAARIDLILLDVKMPTLDGPRTFAELRQIDPEARCCFMSGCIDPYTFDDLRKLGVLAIFEKPFQPTDLALDLLRLVESPEASPDSFRRRTLRLHVPAQS